MNVSTQRPHIVVVGGGAGGLELVTKLSRKLSRKNKAKVTLVDKNRVHIWKPLLHEVATGSLDTDIDAVIYRAHAAAHHYQFQLGEVDRINCEEKTISLAPVTDENHDLVLSRRELHYDVLVLAVGSVCNDFGVPGVSQYCTQLDSQEQAQSFRRRLLNEFLKKSEASSAEGKPMKTSLAVAGAGATGVELSAELHHVVELLKMYDIQEGHRQHLEVNLIEAGSVILPALPERISQAAQNELERLGVVVHTNTRISEVQECGFLVDDGRLIEADLMVWSAGVKAPEWLVHTGLETNQVNQVRANADLKSVTNDCIYLVGDCVEIHSKDGERVPPRAQAAHQMATTVAENIQRELKGKATRAFVYRDYGSLINLSRFSTVGNLMGNLSKGSLMIEGRIARYMYLSLYRMHQLAIHGKIKGAVIIFLGWISKLIRPKIKLH